ncbi:30S ribosomal protein S16 [Dokdonella koreensis]|uniref:Small ribosomal subunit protein bS16 n=1 Tax=Dokdonella koreensis DS-123 TaxID=1300342 RepID=A0A160DTE3_9GAMM|nr:30S ribosomal protein S16 [Dokdonella koreensis]ANB17638.1 30S ribosomal protein S16 [Dokdonella koreensis DS-123]
MVKIRLSRGGAKKRPFYHIVVTDERNARDGRNIERVGFFNPIAAGKDVRLQIDTDRVKQWVEKGAQLTERVKVLYKEAAKSAAQPAA